MIELGRDVEMVDNDLLNCRFNQIEGEVLFLLIVLSLRKHPFLHAVRRWGRFARRNVRELATEIPY